MLLDLGHGVWAGEDGVEHFVFAETDVFEQVGLDEQDGLHADHFENGEQGDDHGVFGFAGFEEFDQRDGIVGRDQAMAEAVHHLRDGDLIVLQLEFGDFFAAFEDLLESFYQVHQGDD